LTGAASRAKTIGPASFDLGAIISNDVGRVRGKSEVAAGEKALDGKAKSASLVTQYMATAERKNIYWPSRNKRVSHHPTAPRASPCDFRVIPMQPRGRDRSSARRAASQVAWQAGAPTVPFVSRNGVAAK